MKTPLFFLAIVLSSNLLLADEPQSSIPSATVALGGVPPADIYLQSKSMDQNSSDQAQYFAFKLRSKQDYKTVSEVHGLVSTYLNHEGTLNQDDLYKSARDAKAIYDDEVKYPSSSAAQNLDAKADELISDYAKQLGLEKFDKFAVSETSSLRDQYHQIANGDLYEKNAAREAALDYDTQMAIYIASKDPGFRQVLTAILPQGTIVPGFMDMDRADLLQKDIQFGTDQVTKRSLQLEYENRDKLAEIKTEIEEIRNKAGLTKEQVQIAIDETFKAHSQDFQVNTQVNIYLEKFKQDQLDKAEYQQAQADLEDYKSASQIFYLMMNQLDPKFAKTFSTFANSGFQIADAIEKFVFNVNPSTLVLTSNLATAGFAICSLFADGTQDANAEILKQLGDIKRQIGDVENLVKNGFIAIDQKLDRVYSDMISAFNQVLAKQAIQNAVLGNIRENIDHIDQRLGRIESQLPEYFEALYTRIAQVDRDKCLEGHFLDPNFTLSAGDFLNCLNETLEYVATDSRDVIALGEKNRSTDPTAIADQLSKYGLERNFQYLLDVARDVLKFAPARLFDNSGQPIVIANPDYWITGVDTYRRLLDNTSDPVNPVATQRLLAESDRYRMMIAVYRRTDFLDALQKYYADTIESLKAQLIKFEYAYKVQAKLSAGPSDKPTEDMNLYEDLANDTIAPVLSQKSLMPIDDPNTVSPNISHDLIPAFVIPDDQLMPALNFPSYISAAAATAASKPSATLPSDQTKISASSQLPPIYRLAVQSGAATLEWTYSFGQAYSTHETPKPEKTRIQVNYYAKQIILNESLSFSVDNKKYSLTILSIPYDIPAQKQGVMYGLYDSTNKKFLTFVPDKGAPNGGIPISDGLRDTESWWKDSVLKKTLNIDHSLYDSVETHANALTSQMIKWLDVKTVVDDPTKDSTEYRLFLALKNQISNLQQRHAAFLEGALQGAQPLPDLTLENIGATIRDIRKKLNGARAMVENYIQIGYSKTLEENSTVIELLYGEQRLLTGDDLSSFFVSNPSKRPLDILEKRSKDASDLLFRVLASGATKKPPFLDTLEIPLQIEQREEALKAILDRQMKKVVGH